LFWTGRRAAGGHQKGSNQENQDSVGEVHG
jgi:hypothetical protein